MIAKSLLFYILLIILPDVILWFRFLRNRRWWEQLLWYIPGFLFLTATMILARTRDFVPDDMTWLNIYLLLMGLITIPKAWVALCSFCGKKGWKVGIALTPMIWFIVIYGSFFGVKNFEVKRVELSFKDLPASFDGYRIVQFTDLHLGSIPEELLQQAVDSINAQHADLVVFTGDIQNKLPQEILEHQDVLKKIKGKDGVISVRGNHDFSRYTDLPMDVSAFNEEYTIGYQQDMDWWVLVNGFRLIKRGKERIAIAGLDNDGEGNQPQKGNINQTLWGLTRKDFVVMLEHDPSAWRRKILTHSHTQLTLSGHTHGMQFELFGFCPLSILRKDVDGLSKIGDRYLYVSKGLGGVVPFRFGATPEIVVFTLRKDSSI
ncbi:MAG: metallophosphoesterase [Prevotella sp.]|nr:metallophosphoesterase [Prevotella sp.]